MCIAVNTTWRNTGITDTDIRRVFYASCASSQSKTRDSKLIWSRKPPPQLSPAIDSKESKPPDHREDHPWSIGECISYDIVGPISPESIEGYCQFKYLFCYPVKTYNEETFLYYLERVLRFFATRGFKPRALRSDYYTTFRSHKANLFYEEHQCRHDSSALYQQWQKSRRTRHLSKPFPQQFTARLSRTHSSTPISSTTHTTNTDLLCFPLQDHERLSKFDVKNDIDFYAGDEDSVKGGFLIYLPHTHNVLTRGNGHRILISDIQLLQWYSQRRDIRRNPLPYSVVKDAVMDLLANPDTPAGNEVRDNPAPHNTGRHQRKSNHRFTDTCHHTTCCPIHRPLLQPPSREQLFYQFLRHQPASDATAGTEQRPSSINPTTSAP